MNKLVKQIKKLLIVLISILLSIVLFTSSIAKTIDSAKTIDDLVACTRDEKTWYEFNPQSYMSKTVLASDKNGSSHFDRAGGYCVEPYHKFNDKSPYKVVNIVDINNNTSGNSIKIYGENGKVNEYSFSDSRMLPVLMLGYLAAKGNNETIVESSKWQYSYKAAMTCVLADSNYNATLKSVGFSDYLKPVCGGYGSSSYKLQEAIREAQKLQSQTNLKTGSLSLAMTEEEKQSVSEIVGDDGKYYVGPYKINLTGGAQVGEIKINGTNVAGISTDLKTVQGFDKIVDNKNFYVVLNNKVDIKNITVTGKEQVNSIKARLLIVSGGRAQNFIMYNAKMEKQKPSISLPVPSFATLQIIKKDKSGKNLNLKDVGFVVWSQSKKAYAIVKNGNVEYVDFETAKKNEFKTDKNGKTQTISKLPAGRYEIYETSIPDTLKEIYDLPETTLKDKNGKTVKTNAKLVKENGKDYTYVQLRSGQTVTVTAVNTRAFANFYIDKKDNKTGQALNGIEFKLYNVKEKGWVKFDKNNVTTSVKETFENASVMVTGTSGTSGLTQTIKKLPVGEYTVYETGLGEYEDIYELGTFKLNGKTYKGKEIVTKTLSADETGVAYYTLDAKGNAYYKAGNTQTYISISGIVWEDTVQDKVNQIRNSVLDENDNRINGIIVRLMDKKTDKVVTREDGREQVTKTYYNVDTKQNGYYKFDKVKIEKLADYYVEFEYDGVTYQNVITPEKSTEELKLTDSNTSKATEIVKNRTALNNSFKELTGEGQVINYNGKDIKVTYNREKNGIDVSVLPNQISDRDKVVDWENGVINLSRLGEFTVNSVTEQNYLKNKYDALTEKSKIITEIENVNLGLYVREKPNVSLIKDVEKADVTINGKAYTYKYERRMAESAIPTTVGVIFERKDPLSDDFYKTPIYRADAAYKTDDKSKELNVYITYKVGLVNNSVTLSTKVNELREIYSKELELVKMSTLEGDNEKVLTNQIQEQVNGNYKTYTFKDLNVQIEAQTTKYLYLTFKLPREQIYNVIQNNINTGKEYTNFAEIGSYTVYSDKFNSLYAGFDWNSIPNNLDVDKYDETDEDDSDKAPGLYIQDAGERTLSGMVFEDNDKDENDNERIGDGKYNDKENKISNVKVRLVDTKGNEVQVYDSKTKQFVNQTSVTNENGEYTISGFIPGDYQVQYTWGEGENTVIKNGKDTAVTVDSYKSTIWTEESRKEKQDAKWFMQKDVRYSDAQDDYNERIRLDDNSASLLDTLKNPINDINAVSNKAVMKSTTPQIEIGIETGEYEEVLTDSTPTYKFNILNVDLGLIERPRLTMDIKKSVDSVKLLTDQRQVILEAKVNAEGKLEVTSGTVTGGPEYGYIRGEVDTDIINSATIAQVGYKVVITNTSEQDYDSKDYYFYGTDKDNNKLIILKAEGIYDYLGGLQSSVNLNNNEWKVLQSGSDETKVDTVTQLMTEKMKNVDSGAIWYNANKDNGTTKLVQQTFSDSVKEIIKKYVEDRQSTVEEFKNLIKENKIISKLTKDSIELKTGESQEFKYYGESTLSTDKDIRFENDVEIANITKNRGRSVVLEHSNLYDTAEWVTITPPTGENKDYTSIIIISIASIVILGAGILVIKKVVLK